MVVPATVAEIIAAHRSSKVDALWATLVAAHADLEDSDGLFRRTARDHVRAVLAAWSEEQWEHLRVVAGVRPGSDGLPVSAACRAELDRRLTPPPRGPRLVMRGPQRPPRYPELERELPTIAPLTVVPRAPRQEWRCSVCGAARCRSEACGDEAGIRNLPREIEVWL